MTEKIKILEIKMENPAEKEIVIEVKGKKISCLVYEPKNSQLGQKYLDSFQKGAHLDIALYLLAYHIKKQLKENKDINQTSDLHVRIEGKIVDIKNSIATIDCGVLIGVELSENSNLEVGDYVKAEGRLDIHKV